MAKARTTKSSMSAKTCKQITELMLDYLTDKLRPKLKREFIKHLSICPDCVSFLNTYKKTVKSTASLRSEEIPAKVRDNILSFLRNKLRRVTAIAIYMMTQLAA